MKKTFITTIIISLLLLTACSSSEKSNNNTNSDLSSFVTVNLSGEDITEEIFSDYDVTMINIWATWCPPCIDEIPSLGELKRQLPDNFNLISICTDGGQDSSSAKDILTSSDANFTTLIPSEEMESGFLSSIDAIPTTVFVDSTGNFIGSRQLGAPGVGDEAIINGYMELINDSYNELN